MSEYSDFAQEVLRSVATAMNLSYDEMVAATVPAKPRITLRMLQLGGSSDRRQLKRALRLYHHANGPGAPHSYFFWMIGQLEGVRWRASVQTIAQNIYAQWVEENLQAGHITIPR